LNRWKLKTKRNKKAKAPWELPMELLLTPIHAHP
jgi:hypothetical protein